MEDRVKNAKIIRMKEKLKNYSWYLFPIMLILFLCTFVFWWRIHRTDACSITFPGVTRSSLPIGYIKCDWYFTVDAFMYKYFDTRQSPSRVETPFITPNIERL